MNRTLSESITAAREYLDPNDVNCVVFHSPCNDGSGAAVAAWLKLGDKAAYERRMYHKEFSETAVRGKNVIVLDASFPREELLALRAVANKVMILDHHHSAMEALGDLPGCFFTMENSGAILSWYYFHGLDSTPPQLLSYIEDRDLWRWNDRATSEPLYYALRDKCSNSDFKTYLTYIDPDKLAELIAYGKTLVAANHKWCEEAALKAELKTFVLPTTGGTYKIMCREIDNDRLTSELSEYLYNHNDIDFVMLWCKTIDGKYKVSFRTKNPEVNVGAIATALGGGGHKQASGAVLNQSPWKLTVP